MNIVTMLFVNVDDTGEFGLGARWQVPGPDARRSGPRPAAVTRAGTGRGARGARVRRPPSHPTIVTGTITSTTGRCGIPSATSFSSEPALASASVVMGVYLAWAYCGRRLVDSISKTLST